MKRAEVLAAAKKAGLPEAQIKKLEAQLPQASAEETDEDETPEDDTPKDERPVDEAEGADDEDDNGKAQTEAQKIAGSPEAAANPAAANAAIRDGLTLTQFQGQQKAAKGGRNQLSSTLEGSRRLGVDGQPKTSAGGGIDAKAIYARRADRRRGKVA